MKSAYRVLVLISVVTLLAVASSACVAPTPTPTPAPTATEPSRITPMPKPTPTATGPLDGETIMRTNCTGCHPLERVVSAKKTREDWDQTVKRMVRLSAVEHPVLLDYLVENYKP